MAYVILSNLTTNKFYPVNNPITLTVNSSNNGNCNYRYVADIYVNNVKVSTIKEFPDQTTGNGVFELQEIIRDYIENVIPKQPYTTYFNLASGAAAPTSTLLIYVKFGEEYDNSVNCTGTVTSYLNLIQTNNSYAFNIVQPYETFLNYNYNDYLGVWASASKSALFLTNSPRTVDVTYNDQYYLDIISLTSPTIASTPGNGNVAIELVRNYKGGTSSTSWYNASTLVNNKRFRIAVGPYDFNGIDNTPVINQFVDNYTIRLVWRLGNVSLHYLSETFTFKVKKPQDFNTRFGWVNQMGGIDHFTFYHRDKKTYDIVRSNFKKPLLNNYANNWTYQYGDRQETTYDIYVEEKHNCSTYVNPSNSVWLSNDLYFTKDAWVYLRPKLFYYEMYREDASNPSSRMLLKLEPDHTVVAGDAIFINPEYNTNLTPMIDRKIVSSVSGSNVDIGITYNNFPYNHNGYLYIDTSWKMLPILIDDQGVPEKQKTGKKIQYDINYHMSFDKNVIR